MLDLHTHLLPGLDDGAFDTAASVEMARSLVADGVTVACGTPHVRDDYPTTVEDMNAALAAVRNAVAEEGLPIDVRGGGELALDRLPRLDPEDLQAFGLGGNPKLLLLETPYASWPLDLPRTCVQLRREGVVPVLAHPERNPSVQERPEILEDVVQSGAVIQLTAASIDGSLGKRTASCARSLIELELAHCIASDAHGHGVREAGMSDACRALGDGEMARWLTEAVPEALLAGEPMPTRPDMPRRHRLPWFRR